MTPRRCKIRWCRMWFTPQVDDLIYCNRCRMQLLNAERGHASRSHDNDEAVATTKFYEAAYREGDYRIIDENGVELWASDLIKRYKRQTKPRAV